MVYRNLPENFLGINLKYKIDGLIGKLHNTLNELTINRNDFPVKTIEEILKTIEDCANCKDKEVERNSFNELHKLINKMGGKYDLVGNLFKMNIRLNKVLCEGCYEVKTLIDKCGNEEIAKFLYECKLNAKHHNNYIRWIPFNEFKNIEYLAKGGFGEVHKATWFYHQDYKEREVVLKRIYNSNDKIADILKEVKSILKNST